MLNDLSVSQQVYLVTGYTDLRRSIDGLAMIVQGKLELAFQQYSERSDVQRGIVFDHCHRAGKWTECRTVSDRAVLAGGRNDHTAIQYMIPH